MTERRGQGGSGGGEPEPSRLLRLGVVVRAHGLGGALEVRPDWSDSRGLLEAKTLVLEAPDGRREHVQVRSARATPKGVLLALAGIEDRTLADERRGHLVLVSREALPCLEPGEYYLSDLVGSRVITPTQAELGRVVEVQMYPSVDAIVIESASGERWEQPLLDEWIERVDVAGGVVVLSSEDGLIEVPRAAGRSPSARPG